MNYYRPTHNNVSLLESEYKKNKQTNHDISPPKPQNCILKKTAWRQEAGETKGHFYLFTFTFNGLPQTETIWICTHIQ